MEEGVFCRDFYIFSSSLFSPRYVAREKILPSAWSEERKSLSPFSGRQLTGTHPLRRGFPSERRTFPSNVCENLPLMCAFSSSEKRNLFSGYPPLPRGYLGLVPVFPPAER